MDPIRRGLTKYHQEKYAKQQREKERQQRLEIARRASIPLRKKRLDDFWSKVTPYLDKKNAKICRGIPAKLMNVKFVSSLNAKFVSTGSSILEYINFDSICLGRAEWRTRFFVFPQQYFYFDIYVFTNDSNNRFFHYAIDTINYKYKHLGYIDDEDLFLESFAHSHPYLFS